MAKEREAHRRSKFAKKSSKGGNISTGPHKAVNRLELFSKMSTEAIQAINETRLEMKEQTVIAEEEEEEEEEQPIAIEQADVDDSNKENDDKKLDDGKGGQKAEDSDSAIGTSSMKSQQLVTQGSPQSVRQECTDTLTGDSPAHHTVRQSILDRPRPATVCANRLSANKRLDTRYPYHSSQWIQDCISRHTPITPIEQNKKMNVFERLSAPSQISYKITARQRSHARLSLAMSSNDKHNDMLAFSQRRESSRETLKCPFPTITRLQKSFDYSRALHGREKYPINNFVTTNIGQKQSAKRKVSTEKEMETSKDVNTENKQNTDFNNNSHPNLTKSYAKLDIHEEKMTPVMDDTSEVSVKILGIDGLDAMEPFKITPEGYDSRYSALRKNAQYANWDFDECEIIRESKMKCRDWLAQQMSVLAKT